MPQDKKFFDDRISTSSSKTAICEYLGIENDPHKEDILRIVNEKGTLDLSTLDKVVQASEYPEITIEKADLPIISKNLNVLDEAYPELIGNKYYVAAIGCLEVLAEQYIARAKMASTAKQTELITKAEKYTKMKNELVLLVQNPQTGSLHRALREFVKREEYEKAAIVRNEINKRYATMHADLPRKIDAYLDRLAKYLDEPGRRLF